MNKQKLVYSSALSATATIWSVVAITILAEQIGSLKDWLASLSGHHWTTKSILSVLILLVLIAGFYRLKRKVNEAELKRTLKILLISVGAGALVLFVYFSLHFAGWY